MDKKEIKEKIEYYELFHSGLKNISGASVTAKNIVIHKRSRLVIADVVIVREEAGNSARYNDCEYPFDIIGVR